MYALAAQKVDLAEDAGRRDRRGEEDEALPFRRAASRAREPGDARGENARGALPLLELDHAAADDAGGVEDRIDPSEP
jgi:hypothetical protein